MDWARIANEPSPELLLEATTERVDDLLLSLVLTPAATDEVGWAAVTTAVRLLRRDGASLLVAGMRLAAMGAALVELDGRQQKLTQDEINAALVRAMAIGHGVRAVRFPDA